MATLPHYDPDYVYDEGHEYEDEWTTDPDYCWDGNHLHWCVFDEEGFLISPPPEHRALIEAGKDILGDVLEPGRILDEPNYYYPEALERAAGLRTEGGAVQTKAQPDLAVLPKGWDDGQLPKSRTLHADGNHPVPELMVEIASPNTAARDRGGKRELYRALGVREHLILDPGRPDGGDLPARLARLTLPSMEWRLPAGRRRTEPGFVSIRYRRGGRGLGARAQRSLWNISAPVAA